MFQRTQNLARVKIVDEPESNSGPGEPVSSIQSAELTLPREELDRVWTPEYLERLARTYWAYLTKISLGLLRVVYGEDCREVVLLHKRLVLLRFHAPDYDTDTDRGTVTWRIERGLLVAPGGRGKGFLRITVKRRENPGDAEITARVSSEVSNFYPVLADWGWFSKVGRIMYRETQLRIHVLVTHGFLRSLARRELEVSKVGKLLSRPDGPTALGASPGRGEPLSGASSPTGSGSQATP